MREVAEVNRSVISCKHMPAAYHLGCPESSWDSHLAKKETQDSGDSDG